MSTASWARGRFQKTCSHCRCARSVEFATSTVCYPRTQAEPLAQATSWPCSRDPVQEQALPNLLPPIAPLKPPNLMDPAGRVVQQSS
eukprot:1149232-Pelagomonas_calceolata.AAC.6